MKNLIIQYYIDTSLYTQPNFNNLYASPAEQYSRHSFEIYCKKYGIDYLRITKPILSFKHPTWERFDLWTDRSWWDKYEQILYVDSDVFALPHAPNIFEKYNNLETFKGAAYLKFRGGDAVRAKELTHNNPLLSDIPGDLIQKKSIQPGVFMLNKKSSEHMLPYISDYKNMSDKKVDDGQFLNYCIIKSNVAYEDMSLKWNHKNNGESFSYEHIYFLHCAGGKKHKRGTKIWQVLKKIYPGITVDLSVIKVI